MRKRRKKESNLEVLLQLPWQVIAGIAVVGFVAFRWVAPSTFRGSAAIAFGPFFQMLAWLVLIGLGLLSLVAFARSGQPLRALDEPLRDPTWKRQEPRATKPLDDSWREAIDAAREAWGSVSPPSPSLPEKWSIDVLCKMEWKRFELVAAAYYRAIGFRAETIRCGADGGIDIKLFRGDGAAISLVQCKAWTSRPVGVKPVRELLGVMVHEKVQTGVFLTTGSYTPEAVETAKGNKLVLVTGEEFLAKLLALPGNAASELLSVATEGAWTTPSCPSCGVKMVERQGKDRAFWGCANFPGCRQTFVMSGSTRRPPPLRLTVLQKVA